MSGLTQFGPVHAANISEMLEDYRSGVVQPHPGIGQTAQWDGRHVSWGDPPVQVDQVEHEFDPADPALYTG